MLLKSVDRGDHWTEISPDLSTNEAKLACPTGLNIPSVPVLDLAVHLCTRASTI